MPVTLAVKTLREKTSHKCDAGLANIASPRSSRVTLQDPVKSENKTTNNKIKGHTHAHTHTFKEKKALQIVNSDLCYPPGLFLVMYMCFTSLIPRES